MSKEQVKAEQIRAVLDRVLTWSPERQEEAMKVFLLMEAQDSSGYRLTDEQVAEVRCRVSDPNRQLVPLAEAFERIGRLAPQ